MRCEKLKLKVYQKKKRDILYETIKEKKNNQNGDRINNKTTQ